MSNLQNPLGALLPVERKRALAALLARHGVPLIEDDVYGELYAGIRRPSPVKAFDEVQYHPGQMTARVRELYWDWAHSNA